MHHTHESHPHTHGQGCGHRAIQHQGHVDYLHDGHLHHAHGDHVDECALPVDGANPERCEAGHDCGAHEAGHEHREGCGHESVPHGDHRDYLVEGHLHYCHDGHCDHHGELLET